MKRKIAELTATSPRIIYKIRVLDINGTLGINNTINNIRFLTENKIR